MSALTFCLGWAGFNFVGGRPCPIVSRYSSFNWETGSLVPDGAQTLFADDLGGDGFRRDRSRRVSAVAVRARLLSTGQLQRYSEDRRLQIRYLERRFDDRRQRVDSAA